MKMLLFEGVYMPSAKLEIQEFLHLSVTICIEGFILSKQIYPSLNDPRGFP